MILNLSRLLIVIYSVLTLSDHFPINFSLQYRPERPSLQPLSLDFRNLSKADFERMVDFLLDWDFSICLHSEDVELI
jgi:hypothetical protein